ncbi:MAG: hypothetical protein U0236_12155 [Nitrospira sp.]
MSVPAGTLTGVIKSFDVTAIGIILEHPEAFHMQLVQVEGIARDIEVLQQHHPFQPGDPCAGAYLFSLEDTTGTLRIGVLGNRTNCGMAIEGQQPEIHEGERLRVNVRIHAPGRYIEKMKDPTPVQYTTTQGIAVQITHLATPE